MFRRRRWPRLPIMLGAGAVVAGGSWLLIQSVGGDPQEAGASPQVPEQNLQQASNRSRDNGDAGVGDFGQPRAPRGAPAQPPDQKVNAPSQQERQREIAAAGERLRAAGADALPPAPGANAPESTRENPSPHQMTDPANANAEEQPAAPQPEPRRLTDASAAARQQLARGLEILDSDPLQARRILTSALDSGALPLDDDENLRMALAHLNDRLIFGRTAHPQDAFARTHKVKSGESLGKIAKDLDLHVDWRFLLRINGMRDARALRAGQDIKVITGPFHAVIDKSDYRLDLYLGEGEERIFVRSFKVGLGEYDSTPAGMFRVGVKQEEPTWVNPRDPREKYAADDPDNPLGDHWLALIGIDAHTRDFTGYGIHGTIEPDSIGRQQSMGCVRMLPEDVKLIFEVLMTDVSMVEIRN